MLQTAVHLLVILVWAQPRASGASTPTVFGVGSRHLTLGVLLPSPTWTGNGAVPLAVDRVNADPRLLPGVKLRFVPEFGCNSSDALKGLGKLVKLTDVDALIGPACSSGVCKCILTTTIMYTPTSMQVVTPLPR